ncbi:hypothetical protein JCM8547_007285 [Rhodosporidiobolus lusitaniae]
MFSLFRRGASSSPASSSSSASPPAIHEPPPPSSARKKKEREWLASISGSTSKGKRGERGIGHTVERDREKGDRKGKGRMVELEHEEDGEGKEGKARSVRSRRSFRLPGGGGGGKGRPSLDFSSSDPPRDTTTTTRRPSSSAPPLSHPSSPPLPPPDPTVNLAQRLQELAVANADGLIGEEEYRVLRARVFEEAAKGEGGAGGEGAAAVLGEGTLGVPRLTSEGVQGGLFRKPSASVRSGFTPEDGSPPSGRDDASIFSGHSARVANRSEPSPGSPPLAGYASTVRARSVRNHPGLSSSALDLRTPRLGLGGSSGMSNGGESVFSVSTEGSYRRPGGVAGYRSPAPLSPYKSRNGHGGASAYSHASSSITSSSRLETLAHPSLPPIPSSSDPTVFSRAEAEPSAKELREEIREIEEEWERVRETFRGIVEGKVREWREEVGEEVVERCGGMVREENGTNRVSALSPTISNGDLATPADKRSSTSFFRRRSSTALLSPSPSSSSLSPRPSASSSSSPLFLPPFLLSHPPAPLPSDLPDDLDALTRTLVSSVLDVRARQKATDERYGKRVEFLKAKERAAELRERLPR